MHLLMSVFFQQWGFCMEMLDLKICAIRVCHTVGTALIKANELVTVLREVSDVADQSYTNANR